MVLHQHAVVEHSDVGWLSQAAVVTKDRGLKDDIVGLPFAGRARRVYQWSVLLVDRGSLAMDIGGVIDAVEDLHLIAVLELDAAIAAVLTVKAFDICRRPPFDMHLDVAEVLLGNDVARTDGPDAIFDRPIDSAAFDRCFDPGVRVGTVEQHNRVRRNSALGCIHRRRYRLPDFGHFGLQSTRYIAQS